MSVRMVLYNLGRRWKKLRYAIGRRPDYRRQLLELLPKDAVGAEIGVWQAEFTERILTIARPRELHLIDPWLYQPEFPAHGYGGVVATCQEEMDAMHARVAKALGQRPSVRIHRAKSSDAMKSFPDGYFDWVYVDGNHEYGYIREDLDHAYAKVRKRGLIAGDDYNWGKAIGYPVRRAIAEFGVRHMLLDTLEILGNQFVLRKP